MEMSRENTKKTGQKETKLVRTSSKQKMYVEGIINEKRCKLAEAFCNKN